MQDHTRTHTLSRGHSLRSSSSSMSHHTRQRGRRNRRRRGGLEVLGPGPRSDLQERNDEVQGKAARGGFTQHTMTDAMAAKRASCCERQERKYENKEERSSKRGLGRWHGGDHSWSR